jgi:hypothetical protein
MHFVAISTERRYYGRRPLRKVQISENCHIFGKLPKESFSYCLKTIRPSVLSFLSCVSQTLEKQNQNQKIKAFLNVSVYIVAYLFKATTLESEKQPLLAYGSETTFFSRTRNRQRNDVVARQHILNKEE